MLRTSFRTPIFLLAALTALACKDPAKGKTKAEVGAAKEEKAEVKGETLAISPENSSIEWVGSKVTGKHLGGFKEFTGQIILGESLEKSQVSVEIQMASVYTDAGDLIKHLQTDDFFAVDKFPTATFKSTAIKAGGEGGATHTIEGNLELRGVKKGITFPATIELGDKEVVVKSEFSINRKDFGIAYEGKKDDLIRDNVVIKLTLRVLRDRKA